METTAPVYQPPVRISREEWLDISIALEDHHAVFYKIWQMGKPLLDESCPSAEVRFDGQTGDFVSFHFNPNLWNKIDFTTKLFVICHEALHIILNHGVRTRSGGRLNHAAINHALDVVVNHSLINNFGFKRAEIDVGFPLCWVDTVFKHKNPLPPDDEMYEYYYNLFEKVYGHGGPGDGDPSNPDTPGILDSHNFMDEKNANSTDWGKVIDALNDTMTPDEKNSLKGIIDKHFQNPPEKDKHSQQAGSGTGTWQFVAVGKVKKKKKWETIIKKWASKYIQKADKDHEQWARLSRRMVLLPKNMFLPSEMEIDAIADKKSRIKVMFFLDTSGSCIDLKDRFFAAALSLPEERFDLRLMCFDTTVVETTLESRKVYGGGGTRFDIIETFIQKEVAKGEKYPQAVFVITDGDGNSVAPAIPEHWYWFLSPPGTRRYIPRNSNIHMLADFE